MTGRLRRKAQARNIHLMWGRTDGLTIKQIRWKPKVLQKELVSMLQRAELAPLDLVRAWDQSQDFSFNQREFMVSVPRRMPHTSPSVTSLALSLRCRS